jgi:hypothetical protein
VDCAHRNADAADNANRNELAVRNDFLLFMVAPFQCFYRIPMWVKHTDG